jgi:hypothetical protein
MKRWWAGTNGGERARGVLRRVPDPLLRLGALAVLVAGVVWYVHGFIVPESFKDPAFQVASVIARETAREPHFVGADACGLCHAEQRELKAAGYHRNVACETCHGPGEAHVASPVEAKPIAPRGREFCPACHAYDVSRPLGFPQINPAAHNPLEACITCHRPHDPKPPSVPSECAACHAGVERTKALSPHARLACTTCHETPQEHKINPRLVRAEKPAGREFCGSCHGAVVTKAANAPQVDMDTHEGKYVCWQCHYPHMPEVES